MNSSSQVSSQVERRRIANYKEKEKCRQLALLRQGSAVFYGAHGGGTFNNRIWEFCIKNDESHKNLYKGIVNECIDYFRSEKQTIVSRDSSTMPWINVTPLVNSAI